MSANCPGFKPHGVKPTRCRRCFKEYNEHVIKDDPIAARKKSLSDADTDSVQQSETLKSSNLTVGTTSLTSDSSTGNEKTASVRVRTRTRELPTIEDSPQEETSVRRTRIRPNPSSESTPTATISSANSVRTRVRTRTSDLRLEPDGEAQPTNNKPRRISKILGAEELSAGASPHDNSPDVEFILRVKTATKEHELDEESIATTDTTETTLVGSVDMLEEYQTKIAGLLKQLEKSEESTKTLEKQNNDLQTKIKRMEKLQENKIKVISDSDKQNIERTASELVKLRSKCRELESNNAELKDEKNVLKIEVKELNREVDAMKKENPRELKETVTNLRLKLQQTEHLCEELTEENEEMKKDVKSLEIEFQELHDNFREDQSSEFRVLKRELETTSKNMRVLQFKLKKAERSSELFENEKIELEKKVRDLLETTKIDVDKHKMKELETELSIAKEVSLKLHAEIEQLREERVQMEQRLAEKNPTQKALNRLSTGRLSPSVSFDGKDYEQVIRDLYDTMEREKDLQEQMKFAEEETRTMRKKLSTMEQENEILMMQIRKMANQNNKNIDEENEELSAEEMKLNLDLYEQEMVVLRRKTDELEQENENFQQEIKYLQEKLVSQPMTKITIPDIPPGSPPNVIYEHKIRILETEARELRKKLVDREKEYESLRTEIEVHRRKASKVIIRSRSLDTEPQVDLKRQLQLVEQEASILRAKLMSIEAENDKLVNENKRFQLRLSRKPPAGPADQLHFENIELKEKIKELERRCENIKSDLMASKSQPNLFLMSDTENDLINTLKKQLKNKESEITTLNTKLTQSDVELNKANREYRKLKDTISARRRPARVIRETATRLELKDIIKELEEDVNEFQNTVRGKDIIIENMTEELSETKREFEQMRDEVKSKDISVTNDLSNSSQMNDKLNKELENEKKKVKTLQTKLDSISTEKGIDFNALDNIDVLQAEKKELAIRLDDIQEELIRERNKSNDLNEKLKAINKQRDELIKNTELSRKQNESLEDNNEVIKEKLRKSEISLKEMSNKYETVSKELNDLKKVLQSTKTELDQHKSKLSGSNERTTGQSSNTSLLEKEINDLKTELNQMKAKAENFRQLNEKMEKEFKDKESKFKEESAKKVEIAVKGVRKEVHLELQQMKEESTNNRTKFNEMNEKIEKSEKEVRDTNDKLKQFNINLRKEREEFQSKITEFDTQMRADLRKKEKLEKEHEMTIKSKDQELFQTRERVVQLEREQRRTQQRLENVEYESNNKNNSLEKELTKERQEYEELTNKYEQLEKEFLEMKSRLVAEKDTLVEAIASIRKSYDEKLSEIKSLKEMLSGRQREWCKEKMDFQEKVATLESKASRANFIEEERNRLRTMVSEKESLLESYRKEEKVIKEERDRLRKRCEEFMVKISEIEKVERLTRTLNITGKDKEIQEYKIRLEHNQTSHKGEVAALHAEYEGRMRLMGEEVNELQRQIAGLANDRDRLRDQLDRDPGLRRGSKLQNDVEDLSAQVMTLRSELESALLENRNLKIQFGTERSGWQIQNAELKTQINQMEERILLETRGANRNFARTKMELSWDKERQDTQRLLKETQKFIQELRDKLLNVEKMREKERLEIRKQLQDLKQGMDRDTEDSHKRVGELQLDLLDLREAHSKIRSQNERLRRERAAYEKERADLRITIFAALAVQNKAKEMINEIEEMNKLVSVEPEKVEKKKESEVGTTVQTTVRKRKSVVNAINIEELKKLISSVKTKSEDLKNVSVPIKDEDRLRHSIAYRGQEMGPMYRGSSQSLSRTPLPAPGAVIRAPPRPKALAKKAVSLDYQIGVSGNRGASQEYIWDSGDSANTTPTSSISNLRISGPYRGFTSTYSGYDSDASYSRYTREGSFPDSETSLPAVPHQKRSLFRFIKKTNSIEDSSTGGGIASAGLTSLALHGFETSPIELAKQRQKKEHSIRYKISKTLSKTFSRSSASLQNEAQNPEKRPTSPTRALSPTRKSGKQSPVPSNQEGQRTGVKPGRSGADESSVPRGTQPLVSKLAIPPSTRSATMARIRAETNV